MIKMIMKDKKQLVKSLVEQESRRLHRNTSKIEDENRSRLNTNSSENSGRTVKTRKAINFEITSQLFRKLEELISDVNFYVLD